ncbi:MAG: hypothetical protein U0790_09765 [Isosphaeraceae bacterium]
MSVLSRRSVLSALGLAVPFGAGARAGASSAPAGTVPALRFRSFEQSLREAFIAGESSRPRGGQALREMPSLRRVEVGHSELVQAGIQGCHNDRPFAGFPAGHLRIVRTGSEPGPVRQGVRLYVTTVDVVRTGGLDPAVPSRPLDFACLPPAPVFS